MGIKRSLARKVQIHNWCHLGVPPKEEDALCIEKRPDLQELRNEEMGTARVDHWFRVLQEREKPVEANWRGTSIGGLA